ncbi:hypothetical protein ACFWIQ_03495 [Kitasatospora sp. NPDC127059]|uniref:hypothetical protein n=1 Tax=unclassified Kitasatospora TaxID=2633591 RepID=UPI00364A06BA
MLLLGLLLLAASGAFTGLLIADNLGGGPEYQVTILGNDLVKLDSLGIFLAGLALALVFCLGLAMMRPSRRASRRPVRTAGYVGDRRVEPTAPVEPTPPLEARGAPPVSPEERAAEQGGRAAGIPLEPQRRRGRHLFGH